MKVYMGLPGDLMMVSVTDGPSTRPLETMAGGQFGWGMRVVVANGIEAKTPDIYAGNTALAVMTDYLGSEDNARKVYQRVVQRYFRGLDRTKPWRLTAAEINTMLAEFGENDADIANIRRMVALAPTPIENDAVRERVDANGTQSGKLIAPENKG